MNASGAAYSIGQQSPFAMPGFKNHEQFNPATVTKMPQMEQDNTKGLLNVTSNDEIVQQEQRADAELAAREKQATLPITSLAGHVTGEWQVCRDAKTEIENNMLNNLRQRRGVYEAQMLAKLKKYDGVELFIKHTDIVCRSAAAWLKDIMLPPGEKPWSIQTTPVPELPPQAQEDIEMMVQQEHQRLMQMQQQLGIIGEIDQQHLNTMKDQISRDILRETKTEARKQERKLENEIHDDLTEGGWYKAIRELLYDVTTFPACFLSGPIPRKRKVLSWEPNAEGGHTPKAVDKIVYEWERVSPFDMYPSPGARHIQEGRLCHRLRWQPQDLEALIGVPGFDEGAINLVLKEHAQGGLRKWLSVDTERAMLENRRHEHNDPMATIDVIKYNGYAQGMLLLQWGMSPNQIKDPLKTYNITAYLVGNYVISARLNPHPLGRRNYYSTSFNAANDSIWGEGIPDMMGDIQKILNACARALVENMQHASGPQQWVNVDRMPAGSDFTHTHPRKVWKFSTKDLKDGIPMGWFQPQMNARELMEVYEYFFKLGSEVTGIPRYIHGSEKTGSGAGATATGLSMLMNAASKGMKMVSGNLDAEIICPSIKEAWLYTMLFKPEKAGGDINVTARASDYLIQQETIQLRRMEFQQATLNPTDLEIMGKEGRAELLRANAQTLKLDTHNIIPDRDDMEDEQKAAEMGMIAQNISMLLGMSPEEAMQVMQGIPPGGPPQGMTPGQDGGQPQQGVNFQNQNAAGQKPSGADVQAVQHRGTGTRG